MLPRLKNSSVGSMVHSQRAFEMVNKTLNVCFSGSFLQVALDPLTHLAELKDLDVNTLAQE